MLKADRGTEPPAGLPGKGPRTITGTSHHLYWDITTRAWTPADHLDTGDHLQTADGKQATIVALRTYTATGAFVIFTATRIRGVPAGASP